MIQYSFPNRVLHTPPQCSIHWSYIFNDKRVTAGRWKYHPKSASRPKGPGFIEFNLSLTNSMQKVYD